jgi:excinuclease ABC subunit A
MGSIQVRGAREHNLKGIDVDIPLGKLTCVTGVSGCGKSSLVHDTLYAESQRMFLEGLSGNDMGQQLMKAPDVDSIDNLRPSLNVSQSYYNFNPRSTVGTVTEVSHGLRSLFALVVSWETGLRLDDAFFSRNNPSSWCPECLGTGEGYAISLARLVPDPTKRLSSGAIMYYKGGKSSPERKTLLAVCERLGIDPDARYCDLSEDQVDALLNRTSPLELTIRYKNPRGVYRQGKVTSRGVLVELGEKLKDVDTPSTLASISKYLDRVPCRACGGSGLKAEAATHKVCGMAIGDAEQASVNELLEWTGAVHDAYAGSPISKPVCTLCERISRRLMRLAELKVGYLSLSRKVPTLSGGESQRVRIANQLSCSLNGLVYILDEPCRGLHPRDAESIITAAGELVKRDNTVVAIEHNPKFISKADWEIRLGPRGGPNGGSVVSMGEPRKRPDISPSHRKPASARDTLVLDHLSQNNVLDASVRLPLGVVTAITGVSGSGKSSLLAAMQQAVDSMVSDKSVPKSKVDGVHLVNQKPIGKTPRSTVASYLGTMDEIRKSFAETEDAKSLGLGPSAFSLNVSGGRCETCQGTGLEKVSYRYLPDTYIECPECHGRRFSDEVLSVRVWDMTVTDVLDTPIEELVERIPSDSAAHEMLGCVKRIGLGYLTLGQTSMSLSGGEAQRIKLAKALGKAGAGKGIYFLDEPTSGLERDDARLLTEALLSLTSSGATVVFTEHDPAFIEETADHVIDLGTIAGRDGGSIACSGSPTEVFANPQSSWAGVLS